MAILKVAKLGNPILRQVARVIEPTECESPDFQAFIDDMLETMLALDGLGLAAPQVSQSKQVVVMQSRSNARYPMAPDLPLRVLINPVLTPLSDEKIEGWESCLSLDNLRGKVPRNTKVLLEAFDREMKPFSFEAEAFQAVVLQHEIDHLLGKVFVDRMEDFDSLTHFEEFDRYWLSQPELV